MLRSCVPPGRWLVAVALALAPAVVSAQSRRTVKADLDRLPRAQATAPLEKEAQADNPQGKAAATPGTGGSPVGTTGAAALPPPSASYKSYNVSGLFRLSVPANWQEQRNGSTVRFAPQGAAGQVNGTDAFILGIEMGLTQTPSGDLDQVTDDMLQSLRRDNPSLQPQGGRTYAIMGGRPALSVTLSNISKTGQHEVVVLTTALTTDGNLLYSIGVSPQDQIKTYRRVFSRINGSVRVER
jgi:hypothetical protein